VEALIEHHLPGLHVVVLDQGAGVVEQQFRRPPAEVPERALDAREPRCLPLVPEDPDVEAPRVAQGGHEQIRPHALRADPHLPLAEVDLQLPPWRRLEAHRRPRLSLQLPP
jgi:hypothetical protein